MCFLASHSIYFMLFEIIKADGAKEPPSKRHKAGRLFVSFHLYISIFIYIYINIFVITDILVMLL